MSEMTEARYSTVDMVGAAADMFSEPENVLDEYGRGVVQLISSLLGLTSDHYDLVLILIQDQVVIQNLTRTKNDLVSKVNVLLTENNLMRSEIKILKAENRS